MNSRQIQPVATWNPETGDTMIDTLFLNDFYHYHFDDGDGKVSYSLATLNSTTGEYVNCFSGSMNIPASIIQQWGASDDIIFDYVAQQLNLIITS